MKKVFWGVVIIIAAVILSISIYLSTNQKEFRDMELSIRDSSGIVTKVDKVAYSQSVKYSGMISIHEYTEILEMINIDLSDTEVQLEFTEGLFPETSAISWAVIKEGQVVESTLNGIQSLILPMEPGLYIVGLQVTNETNEIIQYGFRVRISE
ncbi:hypothetical protein HYG86_10945 [Alkalicella caledoniensis]|uniref:Uncharacterized protein n=1 Tax=Alkalicella caledoniensis TaxID=2731377 RepID=A0A7G9W978_ALKCA|nr:hypothetical protein [Alkalicella caledoniensis]QNO15240.1 hypothetical protein HYG86_10945 [Alkalicella caledoniensis]